MCVNLVNENPLNLCLSIYRNGPKGPGAGRRAIADPSNLEKALLQVLPAARHERKRGSQVRPNRRHTKKVGQILPGPTWPPGGCGPGFVDILYKPV